MQEAPSSGFQALVELLTFLSMNKEVFKNLHSLASLLFTGRSRGMCWHLSYKGEGKPWSSHLPFSPEVWVGQDRTMFLSWPGFWGWVQSGKCDRSLQIPSAIMLLALAGLISVSNQYVVAHSLAVPRHVGPCLNHCIYAVNCHIVPSKLCAIVSIKKVNFHF